VATGPIPTRPWRLPSPFQEDLSNHQAHFNKTLTITKLDPRRPWWLPSLFQQNLSDHQTCSNKTLATTKPNHQDLGSH